MFRFEHINYLYYLFIVPILTLFFIRWLGWRKTILLEFVDLPLFEKLAPGASNRRNFLKYFMIISAISFVLIGIANPQIGTKDVETHLELSEIYIALDVSQSMKAQDVKPDRLSQAKQFISRICDKFKTSRIGLICFAGDAYTVCPLTTDYSALKLFLDEIDTDILPDQGTDISKPILLCLNNLKENEDLNSSALIIITDGENHEENPVSAAEDAVNNQLMVFTIGVGTPEGAPIPVSNNQGVNQYLIDDKGKTVISKLNEAALSEIAHSGGGEYYRLSDFSAPDKLYEAFSGLRKTQGEAKYFKEYESRFQYIFAIVLLILLIELLVSEKRKINV